MSTTITPTRPGHAPGWSWRKDSAEAVERPWPADLPAHVSGLCESNWHNDCPQAPLLIAINGCCACPCHQIGGGQ